MDLQVGRGSASPTESPFSKNYEAIHFQEVSKGHTANQWLRKDLKVNLTAEFKGLTTVP